MLCVSGLETFVVLFPYRVPGIVQPSVTAVIRLEFGLTQTFRMVIYLGSLWMEQTRVRARCVGGGGSRVVLSSLVQLMAHRVWMWMCLVLPGSLELGR